MEEENEEEGNEEDVEDYWDEEGREDAHLGDVCRQVAQEGHGSLPGQVCYAKVSAGGQEQLQDLVLAAPEAGREDDEGEEKGG